MPSQPAQPAQPSQPPDPNSAKPTLSHLDPAGRARMVDVSAKAVTHRTAVASARVTLTPAVFELVSAGRLPKGDVAAAARLAGILAAKRTDELIPLCHPIGLDAVDVDVELIPPETVRITAEARVEAKTGVEMEALTAVSVAALTVYDMCKSADKGITIGPIRLESKTGGKSGAYHRSDSASSA